MEDFENKKYVTLNEASKLFGYSSDYLGFLVREGKIKGKKSYRSSWQTSVKEIIDYCYKRKKKVKKFYSLNKKISLKQASKISGYSFDYIGQLIRTGKLKGKNIKTQVSWLVSKEEVERYKILGNVGSFQTNDKHKVKVRKQTGNSNCAQGAVEMAGFPHN